MRTLRSVDCSDEDLDAIYEDLAVTLDAADPSIVVGSAPATGTAWIEALMAARGDLMSDEGSPEVAPSGSEPAAPSQPAGSLLGPQHPQRS